MFILPVLLVAHISAATGAITWMAIQWKSFGKPTALGVVTGIIATLVYTAVVTYVIIKVIAIFTKDLRAWISYRMSSAATISRWCDLFWFE